MELAPLEHGPQEAEQGLAQSIGKTPGQELSNTPHWTTLYSLPLMSQDPWTGGVHEQHHSSKMIIQVMVQLLMLGHQPKIHLVLRLHVLIRKD